MAKRSKTTNGSTPPNDPWQAALAAHQKGDYAAAIEFYQQHLQAKPDDEGAAKNLIAALHLAGRSQEALEFGREAVRRFPKSADMLANIGTVLSHQAHHDRAAKLFEAALAIDGTVAQTWLNLGHSRVRIGNLAGALAAFESTVAIEPNNAAARAQLVHQGQQALAWDRIDQHLQVVRRMIAADDGRIDPWALMSNCHDPVEHLRCATAFSKRVSDQARQLWDQALIDPLTSGTDTAQQEHRPLRVGYISADFREHPTSYLAVQLIENHDRSKVEPFGYAIDPPNGGPMRQRMTEAFDHFREIGGLNTVAAAQRIAQDKLDVLIDLMGYTQMGRPDILALRPAPVQVGYLGFAGSTGADFIDYIIADHHVFPEGDEALFSEAPIRMPLTYQVNDGGRAPIKRPRGKALKQAREANGLPAEGVVFASFNQFYKLTPDILSLWIAILKAVPDSVLWVVGYSDIGVTNLRHMLSSAGIDKDRLVIAPIANLDDHLQRYGIADIMLDTHPYGGHTTASDALRAGCPVITLTGKTFASRVGKSLLTTLGFPQLVAADRESYARIAVQLAQNPKQLKALQRDIWKAAQNHPMFDGKRFARDLEAALEEVCDRSIQGMPPAAIALPSSLR